MTLKKLLSGVTAAIMTLSSVAIASFTSVSATDTIKPATGWYGTNGSVEGHELKLIQDWSASNNFSALSGQSNVYVAFSVSGVSAPMKAYLAYSVNSSNQNWDISTNCPAVDISKDGNYVVSATSSFSATMVYMSVVFKDTDGKTDAYTFTGASLIGVYLTEPTDEDLPKPSNSTSESSSDQSSSEQSSTTNNTAPTNSSASTTAPTTKLPTVNTTRSADVVKKDKAVAKKAMKQAKITKLTVNSKAKKKINVSWKKVKKAKGYQVQVSTKKNFKKVIFKKFVTKNKLTIKNSKISSKKTYYVRVRAYATYLDANGNAQKVYSKWNKQLRKVKVK